MADGTFPPVSQHSSIRQDDQGTLVPVVTGISAAALTLPPPISLERQAAGQGLRVAQSELAHAYEQAVQPIATDAKAIKADEPKPHTEVETEPVEKKNANQHGKKRKVQRCKIIQFYCVMIGMLHSYALSITCNGCDNWQTK